MQLSDIWSQMLGKLDAHHMVVLYKYFTLKSGSPTCDCKNQSILCVHAEFALGLVVFYAGLFKKSIKANIPETFYSVPSLCLYFRELYHLSPTFDNYRDRFCITVCQSSTAEGEWVERGGAPPLATPLFLPATNPPRALQCGRLWRANQFVSGKTRPSPRDARRGWTEIERLRLGR